MLDWDPGWILVMVADCGSENFALYQPWFQRVLLSLERVPEERNESGVGSGGPSAR